MVYENSDFMIMVVGGPNSRKDYHVDPVEEFYQVEGDMVLRVMDNHNRLILPLRRGRYLYFKKYSTLAPEV